MTNHWHGAHSPPSCLGAIHCAASCLVENRGAFALVPWDNHVGDTLNVAGNWHNIDAMIGCTVVGVCVCGQMVSERRCAQLIVSTSLLLPLTLHSFVANVFASPNHATSTS